MGRNTVKIIFFSEISEVKEYIRCCGIEAVDLCIAMKPAALAYLRQNGFAANDTTRYFTNSSHERALEKSKDIMDWLERTAEFVDPDIGVKDSKKGMMRDHTVGRSILSLGRSLK